MTLRLLCRELPKCTIDVNKMEELAGLKIHIFKSNSCLYIYIRTKMSYKFKYWHSLAVLKATVQLPNTINVMQSANVVW